MSELYLTRPGPEHEAAVMAFRRDLLDGGQPFDGCAGLEDTEDYASWLDFEGRLSAKYGSAYVPSHVFLALHKADGRLVGIVDYRSALTDFLLQYGGNIGYSVHPALRRRGYGKAMLSLALEECRALGAKRVLICCDKANLASVHTILAGGGVLENEVPDTVGLAGGGIIQRYWVNL